MVRIRKAIVLGRRSIGLQTNKGTDIPNETHDLSLLPTRLAVEEAEVKKRMPNSQLRRLGTARYNCFGLLFASRRTGITDDQFIVSTIPAEDDLSEFKDPRQAQPGDIALYFLGDDLVHASVVVENGRELAQPLVLSKCGAQIGEYFHPLHEFKNWMKRDEVDIRFWTDRPQP